MALALTLTPTGHLRLVEEPGAEPLPASLGAGLREAWAKSPAEGLLHLGLADARAPLPAALDFWRGFARGLIAAVCTTAELEELRERVTVAPPDDAELEALLARVPPFPGAEYVSAGLLLRLHGEVLGALREALRETHGAPVEEFFAAHGSGWHVVGRVHLHLAENKRDPARPFAFLATYTTGLSAQGKPQHRPLGDAVRESSSARDKARHLALLTPLQRAAASSPYVKELVDSGQAFRPLAWTPREAYRFLKEVPALEHSGVVVRVPDWWKARPRPKVTVTLGQTAPSALGLSALLDFNVAVTLGGAALSRDELKALAASADGLALLKGQWVEVDQAKLDEVLRHWRRVEAQAGDGLTLLEGLRQLSGMTTSDDAGEVDEGEWSGVEAGAWLRETLERLRAPGSADPGPALQATLRPYQRAGVAWLWSLSQLKLGACLADDMGLGKTLQVLALLLLQVERGALTQPALLVAPASLLANWQLEAQRFAPSLRVLVAHPSAMARAELQRDGGPSLEGVHLVVTSYGSAARLPWLRARRWSVQILDEAQAIKNPGAKQTKAVKALEADTRVALTGTPVENRLGDLWSLFDFLNPGLLGSAKEFSAFVRGRTSFTSLRALTAPYLLRRLKTDKAVIADLPEKTELETWCPLSQQQAALYQAAVDSLAEELETAVGMKRRGLVLSYLTRFKQICNHPSQWLGDGAWAPAHSGKHGRLRELCEEIAARQEKVLVFTQFREAADPLARWLAELFGRPGLVLTGETSVKARQGLVRSFQEDDDVPFFVLSVKAGGTGLNLTAASHVIHFDRWWNPAVENQATDRAFRIGQRRNVLVHKFICRGTVEERVNELIASKRALANEVLEGGDEVKLTELDDTALLKLVALDLNAARSDEE